MEEHKIFGILRRDTFSDFLAEIGSVDINITNEFEQNLLHEAVTSVEATVELLKRGINVDHREYKGMTPLHYAAVHRQFEIAELILAAGARIDIADDYGNQVLWTATFNAKGDYRLVKSLIAAGANAHHKNNAGRSPLNIAARNDRGLIDALSGR